jgi:metallophosphoesterase superfamily enzyme
MRIHAQGIPPTSPRTEVLPGVWLDARLALWFAAERLLVVADLHWGYAASHRAQGNLLPIWGDDEIEQRLQSLLADYQPAEMLWLGDVVHAAAGSARAEEFLRASSTPVVLIAGNHDRRWSPARERSVTRGRFFFHHGDRPSSVPAGCLEIVGHHHPAASWADGAGGRLKLPALIAGSRRLILPAFSPWAAGTPWNDQLSADETLWAVAPARIFALPRAVSSLNAAVV